MLDNQSFSAEPLVVVGPELFTSGKGFADLNFDHIFRVRNHIHGFVFVYVGLADSQFGEGYKFSESLLKLGVPLRTVTVLDSKSLSSDLDDPELRQNLGSLLLNADLVYSPEFVSWFSKQGGTFSNKRNYIHRSDIFLDCLAEFSSSAVPFSPNYFFDRYSSLIGRSSS